MVPFERIVTSAEFDEGPGVPTESPVLTCVFQDVGKKTQLHMRIEYTSAEARKAHEDMDVVSGQGSNFDSLDGFLWQLVAAR